MLADELLDGVMDAPRKLKEAFIGSLRLNPLRPEEIAADFLPNLQLGFLAEVLESDFHKRVCLRFNVAASIDLTRLWANEPPDALVCPGGALRQPADRTTWIKPRWRLEWESEEAMKKGMKKGKTARKSGFILQRLGLKTLPPWKRKRDMKKDPSGSCFRIGFTKTSAE